MARKHLVYFDMCEGSLSGEEISVIYTLPPITEIPVGFQLDSRILGEFQFCICFLNNSRNTNYRH